MKVSEFWKSLIALGATLAALFVPLVTGDHSGANVINVAILAGGTILVWLQANTTEGITRVGKVIVGAITAALVVAQSALSDGVTNDEWKQIAVAGAMVIIMALKGDTAREFAPAATLSVARHSKGVVE